MKKSIPLVSTEKMKLELDVSGPSAAIRPIGVIDEDINFGVVLQAISGLGVPIQNLTFDLGNITRINTCGVRAWLLLVERLPKKIDCIFINVNELMIVQANMIPAFLGKD